MPFLAPLAIVVITLLGWSGYQEYKQPIVGAFGDPFISIQLAEDPSNGLFLSTDGTDNVWTSLGDISGFSTTSADYWQTQRNFFSTTSADYWKTVNNFFSTTSASYFSSLGLAFSTTSSDYWETQQTARTADDLSDNSIEDLNDVAAMTENYGDLLYWNGSSWADIATTSLGISGGSSFDYPFPNNATSTAINFSNGLEVGYNGLVLDNDDTGFGATLQAANAPGSWIATFPAVTGTVPLGTGASTRLAYWSSTNELTSSANLTFATPTTTAANLNVTTAVTILGEYFTNFTTYVRSLFSGSTGITLSSGAISFDCSEVEGTGINCSSENITLDATGDWTGTLDSLEGASFAQVSGDTYTGTHDFSGGTVKQHTYPTWTWPGAATTTTATTTVPIGQAMSAQAFNFSTCRMTSGSGGYRYSDGSNAMNYIPASTTRSRYTLSSNNTFIADENRIVEIGPMTAAQITCGLDITVNN